MRRRELLGVGAGVAAMVAFVVVGVPMLMVLLEVAVR